MKALVGAFNQEKALVGAFSMIVKTGCETDGALHSTSSYPSPLQSTHTKFSDHGPATAGCCWDNKKQKKCPQRALLQKAVLCIVYGTIEAQAPAPLKGQCDTRGHGAVDSLFVLMEANTKKNLYSVIDS